MDDVLADNRGWIDSAFAVIIDPHDWKFTNGAASRNFQVATRRRDFGLLVRDENLFDVRRVNG